MLKRIALKKKNYEYAFLKKKRNILNFINIIRLEYIKNYNLLLESKTYLPVAIASYINNQLNFF